MNADRAEEPDELADVLAPRPGTPSPEFRAELLRRTERHLARVRWVRRGAKAVAVAAVFLAGWFARSSSVPPPLPASVPDPVVVPVVVLVPVPTPAPVADAPGSPEQAPGSPAAAELLAEQADDRAEAARLYRVAGDAFLGRQDYPNAARCYRLFLARSGDTGLSLEPADSWLLTSLKNAAFKEKTDAPKTDG